MKLLLFLILSLSMHSLMFISIWGDKPVKSKKVFPLSINKIEHIKSKKMVEKNRPLKSQSRLKEKDASKSELIRIKGLRLQDKYLSDIRKLFLANFSISKKAQILKLEGRVDLKIQIQRSGAYDVLYLEGDHPELKRLAQKTLDKIQNFQPIPKEIEDNELQLKVPLVYKFN